MIRVRDADHARELILRAMERRWRITVGYWEVKREPGTRRIVKDAAGREQYVHTVRTIEPFDINAMSLADYFESAWSDADYVTAMDAVPREGGGPAIRRVRMDRITDVTIHKRHPYRMRNTYFMGKVRQHAADMDGEGWGAIAALSDPALWSLIEEAWSADDAVARAAVYAEAMEVATT